MPNPNYIKGVRKERKIVNEHRNNSEIAFRSAGSHSPIDVCCIDIINKKIMFLQCKPDDYAKSKINKIKNDLKDLNGAYTVEFDVI